MSRVHQRNGGTARPAVRPADTRPCCAQYATGVPARPSAPADAVLVGRRGRRRPARPGPGPRWLAGDAGQRLRPAADGVRRDDFGPVAGRAGPGALGRRGARRRQSRPTCCSSSKRTGPPHARLTRLRHRGGRGRGQADLDRLQCSGHPAGYVAPECSPAGDAGSPPGPVRGRAWPSGCWPVRSHRSEQRATDVPAPLVPWMDLCAERLADGHPARPRHGGGWPSAGWFLSCRRGPGPAIRSRYSTRPARSGRLGAGRPGADPADCPDPAVRQHQQQHHRPAEPPSTATLPDPSRCPPPPSQPALATRHGPLPVPMRSRPWSRRAQPRRATRRRLAVVAGAAVPFCSARPGGALAYVTSRPDTGPDDGGGASPSQAVSTGSGTTRPGTAATARLTRRTLPVAGCQYDRTAARRPSGCAASSRTVRTAETHLLTAGPGHCAPGRATDRRTGL